MINKMNKNNMRRRVKRKRGRKKVKNKKSKIKIKNKKIKSQIHNIRNDENVSVIDMKKFRKIKTELHYLNEQEDRDKMKEILKEELKMKERRLKELDDQLLQKKIEGTYTPTPGSKIVYNDSIYDTQKRSPDNDNTLEFEKKLDKDDFNYFYNNDNNIPSTSNNNENKYYNFPKKKKNRKRNYKRFKVELLSPEEKRDLFKKREKMENLKRDLKHQIELKNKGKKPKNQYDSIPIGNIFTNRRRKRGFINDDLNPTNNQQQPNTKNYLPLKKSINNHNELKSTNKDINIINNENSNISNKSNNQSDNNNIYDKEEKEEENHYVRKIENNNKKKRYSPPLKVTPRVRKPNYNNIKFEEENSKHYLELMELKEELITVIENLKKEIKHDTDYYKLRNGNYGSSNHINFIEKSLDSSSKFIPISNSNFFNGELNGVNEFIKI